MIDLCESVCKITGAHSVVLGPKIQDLWSGYGFIQRAELCLPESEGLLSTVPVIIKRIDISTARTNRRGWGSDISHQRKIHSYQVEKNFYERFSCECDELCQVPSLIAAQEDKNSTGWLIVMTDLDFLGFADRKHQVEQRDIHACLIWLANFHATFLGNTGVGLWPVGTYWHLKTRPDELAAMPAGLLKKAASSIDERLNSAKYQTLVHGDAKVANFCFPAGDRAEVAAVDFQYVGRGCGMKDVAYLISSGLSEEEAARQEETLLVFYFDQLKAALIQRGVELMFDELEDEWRALYPFAWADFCRFLSGWSPGHWKLNAYSEEITQAVLRELHLG